MKKHIYRAKNVKSIDTQRLAEALKNQDIIVGIDVGKEDMYAVFMTREEEVILTIKWKHPHQTMTTIELMKQLPVSSLEVALEPSGTYSDSIRYHVEKAGIAVYRVSPKKSHDYREIHDGVPSSHDAKSAAIVAALHLYKKSGPWTEKGTDDKTLRAAVSIMDMYHHQYQRKLNQLDALLARHWPELTGILDLTSVSILELLKEYGSAQAVADDQDAVRRFLKRVSHQALSGDKIEQVLTSASSTVGVPPLEMEVQLITRMAAEARRDQQKLQRAKAEVERLSQTNQVVEQMGQVVGKVTAAVFYAYNGDPADYSCADAYVKAFGLNLKVRSSGKHIGQLKITKRAASQPRQYGFLAILRLIQRNAIFQAWYERKIKRDGGKKMKAIVALMPKLIRALWYVGQGNPFEAQLLFDTTRLKLIQTTAISD